MPTPTHGDLHVLAPLTNITVAYLQSANDFIASQVFPIVPVQKESDLYYEFAKDDWFRDEAKLRGPRSESAGGGWNVTTKSYSCQTYAYHHDIDDRERANADSVFALDSIASELVARKLLIRREKMFLDSYFVPGVWANSVVGVASGPTAGQTLRWSAANSDPVQDVDKGKEAMLSTTGFLPTVLTIGYSVFLALRNNARIRDQLKYTTSVMASAEIMARMFDVERVVVSRAVLNSANEGATGSYNFMSGKHALLSYAPPAPALQTPSAGYIMAWSGYMGAVSGARTKKFRMDHLNSDRVESELSLDMKRVSSDLGYFMETIA